MYKHNERQMILPDEFCLPFGGKLNPKNRWCQLAAIIPWDEVEDRYAKNFKSQSGQAAYSVRVALGALIIQNRKSLSDRELVEEISENPYLQYFLGFKSFVQEKPFDPSLMVHFRKRLGKSVINEINELIAKPKKSDDNDSNGSDENGGGPGGNGASGTDTNPQKQETEKSGKLILDATCTPADIHYPTDLWLLNEVREALEEIIDVLHEPHIGSNKKPRTYRERARKDYLNIDKQKRKSAKKIRKGVGQQLRYIKRDLKIVKDLSLKSPLTLLDKRQYRNLLVCNEIYRQQLEMYRQRIHKVEDRIVSLHMPFILSAP